MTNPFQSRFATIFFNEVRLHSKRVTPYVLMVLFSANAILWWGRGPAVDLGWATNSDFYIARSLKGFSFLLGLPIFNAIIMGDAVIRDFRLGVVPLIFSKPINRAQYLFGKFFGSFFVLVCCQAAFPLTQIMLQAFRRARMVVQPAHVLIYFKHFFFFVVITHLALAALYFSVGALTRNSKIVYGVAVCFYPFYLSVMLFLLRGFSIPVRTLLDPFLLNTGPSGNGFGNSSEFLNQYVYIYSASMIANRVVVILFSAACLLLLYWRFCIAERAEKVKELSVLNLSSANERIYFDSPSPAAAPRKLEVNEYASIANIILPRVTIANEKFSHDLKTLLAAVGVEFRLLRAERSLIVLLPLAVVLSIFDVAFFRVTPEVSYSATYATSIANAMLLFMIAMSVFYTGESMHRDRELRIEPVLWSAPVSNSVLLMSKFMATLALTCSLAALTGLIAIGTQFLRGHRPVELRPYLLTYSLVLFPGLVFLAAMALVLNVVLREKYVTYAVSVGIAAAMFYLYSIGYLHWLYNPLGYRLWKYADLVGVNRNVFLLERSYWLVLAILLLGLAHVCFARKTSGALFPSAGKRVTVRKEG